jgi:hypothetical protein
MNNASNEYPSDALVLKIVGNRKGLIAENRAIGEI